MFEFQPVPQAGLALGRESDLLDQDEAVVVLVARLVSHDLDGKAVPASSGVDVDERSRVARDDPGISSGVGVRGRQHRLEPHPPQPSWQLIRAQAAVTENGPDTSSCVSLRICGCTRSIPQRCGVPGSGCRTHSTGSMMLVPTVTSFQAPLHALSSAGTSNAPQVNPTGRC